MKKFLVFISFCYMLLADNVTYKEAVKAFNEGDCLKADNLYAKLVKDKHPDSAFNYGWMYEKGQCVKQDYKKARELYEIAIASDNTHAKRLSMYRMGLLLLTARGSDDVTDSDKQRAIILWNESENLGYAQASLSLGTLYFQGSIVKKDEKKARKYFSKACDANIKEACTIIANLKVN